MFALSDELLQIDDSIQVIGAAEDHSNNLNHEEFSKSQANDLQEVLSSTPNTIVGGSLGISQKIYLRGIEDNKLNVSIDGASQTGQVFQAQGRLSVEPMLLKQVEVTQGAGSALNGFGALGGAVKFHTKDASDFLRPDQKFGTAISTRYSSNNNGLHLNSHLFGAINEQWSSLLSLGVVDTENVKDGAGNSYSATAVENNYILFKLSGSFTEESSLNFSYDRLEDEGIRTLRPNFKESSWNPKGPQANNRETWSIGYQFDDQQDLLDLTANAYKTHNFVSVSENGEVYEGYIDTYGLDLRNSTLLEEHDLVYGFAKQIDKGVFSSENVSEKGWVAGVYIQDVMHLNDYLVLDFGGRYDYYQLDAYGGDKLSAKGFSPNANVTYFLSDELSVKAGYARVLRGPQIKQVFAIKNSPSSNLKEEIGINKEINIDYLSDTFAMGATFFLTEVKDVIGFLGTIGPQDRTYANLGNLKTKGYSVWARKEWQNSWLQAAYSVTRPELNSKPLNDRYVGVGTSFGDRLMLTASHYLWANHIELGWQSTFVEKLENPELVTGKKDGYDVHNIYMQWQPSTSSTGDWEVTISVNNLFDKLYYDHASFRYDPDTGNEIGIPALGRDIRLSISWLM